jgi:hypothetical protein
VWGDGGSGLRRVAQCVKKMRKDATDVRASLFFPRNCWQFLSQFAESLFRTIARREEEEEELIDDVVCTLMHTGTGSSLF